MGEQDVVVEGKRYDRAKISQFIVETKSARQTFSPSAQNYEQIARDVAMDPLGGYLGLTMDDAALRSAIRSR